MFGMGTGGSLQPLPPEIGYQVVKAFASSRFLAHTLAFSRLRPPSCVQMHRTLKTAQEKLTSKHFQTPLNFSLPLRLPPSRPRLRSRVRFLAPPSVSGSASVLLRSSPRPISTGKLSHYCVYTAGLSTLSSSRGLTYF